MKSLIQKCCLLNRTAIGLLLLLAPCLLNAQLLNRQLSRNRSVAAAAKKPAARTPLLVPGATPAPATKAKTKPPTITYVSPAAFTTGDTVILIGTNFDAAMTVTVDTSAASGINCISAELATLVVEGPVTDGKITVTTTGGTARYPIAQSTAGNVDFMLPDLGGSIFIVPTPTFNYTQVKQNRRAGFTAVVWANSIGTDSTLQRTGSKFLMPQSSLFGIKLEGAIRLNPLSQPFSITLNGEVNLLVKKISFYDTTDKSTIGFNPFVVHPRIGVTASFFEDIFYAGAYLHCPAVLTENEMFRNFFKTGSKNVFVYPEINTGVLFDISQGGNQMVKVEADILFNNGDVSYFCPSGAAVPYLKVGFVSKL